MKLRIWLIITSLLVSMSPLVAQDITPVPYNWDTAGFTFLYPAEWDAPVPSGSRLELAEALAEVPEIRPPGVPVLTLSLLTDDSDRFELLLNALTALDIVPGEPTPVTMLGGDAQEISGTSTSGGLIGIGRVAITEDGQVLLLVGRAPAEQAERFRSIYDLVASSLTFSGDPAPPVINDEEPPTSEGLPSTDEITLNPDESPLPEINSTGVYGVEWRTLSSFDEGEEAFINLINLAYAPTGMVYSYDFDLGLIQFDAQTGAVQGIFPNENILEPTAITADAAGTVYVSDISCACVYRFTPGSGWNDQPITGFSENSPESIAVTASGILYGTTESEDGLIAVSMVQNGAVISTISLPEEIFIQPKLALDPAGRVLALAEDSSVFSLENNSATLLHMLNVQASIMLGFSVTSEGYFALLTEDQGLIVVDAQGGLIDQPAQIVAQRPQPGQVVFPSGLAAGPDGTLYIADSDGEFGAVTAFRPGAAAPLAQSTVIALDMSVQGLLDENTPEQSWTFDASAGQQITISAIDDGDGSLNPALRLLNPAGVEEAFNDNQADIFLIFPTDAQIVNHLIAETGTYTIVVERINGSGFFRMGLRETQALTLANGTASVTGTLDDLFALDLWEIQGEAGQVFTFTMTANSDEMDTSLRLVGPDGVVLAENNDAEDETLGLNAQIVSFTLPDSGLYIIEASRFSGSGSYQLAVTSG